MQREKRDAPKPKFLIIQAAFICLPGKCIIKTAIRCFIISISKSFFIALYSERNSLKVESLNPPLLLMWAPSNTVDCPAPQQPGRTYDSPSGCRPRTGAPLHHPVETKLTSVFLGLPKQMQTRSISAETQFDPFSSADWSRYVKVWTQSLPASALEGEPWQCRGRMHKDAHQKFS